MKLKLLEYLVCPACKGALALNTTVEENGEVMEGFLTCGSCSKTYFIVRGVPRMLSEKLAGDQEATAEAFGYEWTHFTKFASFYQNQFLDWIAPVQSDFFKGKVILDAGCGKGRHVYLAANYGAADVIGVDVSDAVDVAFGNTRGLANVHIVQADIYRLPFKEPFDFIYSIGVLHHLPDPRKGFFSLLQHLKIGGRISVWVYGREGNDSIVKYVNPIRVHVTSKIPKAITKGLAYVLAGLLQFLLVALYRPANEKPGWSAVKARLPYNTYLYSISHFPFSENFSIIFDHLVAPTAFYISFQEISSWLERAYLQDTQVSQRNGNSWRATGVKM